MALPKVAIFRDDDSSVAVGMLGDPRIGRAIAVRKL